MAAFAALTSSPTVIFFFSSRRRHTRWPRDWSSDVCSSDLAVRFPADPRKRTADPGVATGLAYTPVGGDVLFIERSEERRVGKECRSRWARHPEKKKRKRNPVDDHRTQATNCV